MNMGYAQVTHGQNELVVLSLDRLGHDSHDLTEIIELSNIVAPS